MKVENTKKQETPDVDPSFAPIVAAFAKDRQVSRKRCRSQRDPSALTS